MYVTPAHQTSWLPIGASSLYDASSSAEMDGSSFAADVRKSYRSSRFVQVSQSTGGRAGGGGAVLGLARWRDLRGAMTSARQAIPR